MHKKINPATSILISIQLFFSTDGSNSTGAAGPIARGTGEDFNQFILFLFFFKTQIRQSNSQLIYKLSRIVWSSHTIQQT